MSVLELEENISKHFSHILLRLKSIISSQESTAMESTGKSPVSSDRKPKRKILSSSAISKTPNGKSVAASEIAIKPNGKTAVSSAIPRLQSSSAHGDDVMFFRDVTMRPHQEELRFRLIYFWEARNPNTKTLTGVEMLLIDEQVRLLLIGWYSNIYVMIRELWNIWIILQSISAWCTSIEWFLFIILLHKNNSTFFYISTSYEYLDAWSY